MCLYRRPPEPPLLELSRRDAGAVVPLTPAQLRDWQANSKSANTRSSRSCFIAARMGGVLNVNALQQAISAVWRRHESLRTLIADHGELPQCVFDHEFAGMEVVDLGRGGEDGQSEALNHHVHDFLNERASLSHGPLFKSLLLRISESENVFFATVDHFVSDQLSEEILRKEIWQLYIVAASGGEARLPDLAIQFGDYAAWRAARHNMWGQRHDEFWSQYLSAAPCAKAAHLVRESATLSDGKSQHAMRSLVWDSKLYAGLVDAAKQFSVRFPMVLLTAYVLAIMHWSRMYDIVVPVVHNGRHLDPKLREMVGFLAGELYVRFSVNLNSKLSDTLAEFGLAFADARKSQELGRVPDLYRESSPELGFNYQLAQRDGAGARKLLSDMKISLKPFGLMRSFIPQGMAPFFFDSGRTLSLVVHYRADQFSAQSIEDFVFNVKLATQALVAAPHSKNASLAFR